MPKKSLWNAADIIKATNGRLVGDDTWQANGIAMDSREVGQGDIFIALKGTENGLDGHNYIPQAIANGAVCIICNHEIHGAFVAQIVVVDTFKALQDMAVYARSRASLSQAIAITGSVGKTGTRNFMQMAFIGAGAKTHASIKSYNNHVGVPYTLANMTDDTEIGVFEVGMNHANEITPLSRMIKPTIAVITTIADVHIEAFADGIHGIVNAKSEIFDGMTPDGMVILPRDNPHYDALIHNANRAGLVKIYSFGENDLADARLIDCEMTADGTSIKARILGEDVDYDLKIAGKHIAVNSLAVLLAVKLSGYDTHLAAKALGNIEPLAGRGQRMLLQKTGESHPIKVINESYNASPVAMIAAFNVLRMIVPSSNGRRIAILGDMRELGDRSRMLHETLLDPLLHADIDVVHCCGPYMKYLYDGLPDNKKGIFCETSIDLASKVVSTLNGGDVVLVKGSLGSNMKVIVEALTDAYEEKSL